MDEDLSQDIEGTGDNDRYAEISKGHDEDSSRGQHNNYRDGRHNSESQY